jgi:hypothetical protein
MTTAVPMPPPPENPIRRALLWLNKEPGRKRTIAAVAAALSVLLRGLDYGGFAVVTDAIGPLLDVLTPTADIFTIVFTLVGIADKQRRNAQGVKDGYVEEGTFRPLLRTDKGFRAVERRRDVTAYTRSSDTSRKPVVRSGGIPPER